MRGLQTRARAKEGNGTLSSERRARTMQPTACGRFERGGGAPTVGARRAGWARIAGCRGHPDLGTDVGGDGMAKAPASRVRDVKGGLGVGGAEEGAKGRPYKRVRVIREASLESRMGCAACPSSPVRAYGKRQCCRKPSTIYASFPPSALCSKRKRGRLSPDECGRSLSHRRGPVQEVDLALWKSHARSYRLQGPDRAREGRRDLYINETMCKARIPPERCASQ
ncbi:hypothetical protein C8J57DRAFT_1304680 [Mycena rebaudengoi]|nr:hypothetical protein C8J57DRAFT_1304680 [Mycena rebaudengoi]